MRNLKLFFSIILATTLISCSQNRNVSSHFGAVIGGASAGATCYQLISQSAPLVATCAVLGSFAGAELFYKSDRNVHNAVFVDHLNTAPSNPSYVTWFNPRTGNKGDIKINRSYVTETGMKCSDYQSTIDIEASWPLSGLNRSTEFGIACQHPDGVWEVVDATS